MYVIPISDVPSQTLTAQLGGQSVQINLYVKSTGLFADVAVNNAQIIGGVICENMNRIVRDLYLGFIGDLVFYDMEGAQDPTSPGLGSRYLLVYLEAADLAGAG